VGKAEMQPWAPPTHLNTSGLNRALSKEMDRYGNSLGESGLLQGALDVKSLQQSSQLPAHRCSEGLPMTQ